MMISTRVIGALSVAVALAGCGGSSAPLLDMSAVGSGDGSLDDPYILPAEHPAGTTGGIGDYFDVGGVWQIGYASRQVDLGSGAPPVFDTLKYNTVTGEWILNAHGEDFVLAGPAPGDDIYEFSGCPAVGSACVDFEPYQDAGTRLYGIFAVGWYEDTDVQTALLAYGGMKTPEDSMPTSGSATYVGTFRGFVTDVVDPGVYDVEGIAGIGVDFDAADKQVTVTSSGKVFAADGSPAYDYKLGGSLGGSATIAGNIYSGTNTLNGTVTVPGVVILTYIGSINGAFFGPGAAQTAGVVEATDDASGSVLAGGFWAAK